MGSRPLMHQLLGVEEADLARLTRFSSRLLLGSPSVPYGSSPRRLRAGSGLEFLDHASYVQGADARFIDWRASARSREPVVRRYQDEALFDVHLCLDRSASMRADGGAKWILVRQVALTFAYLLLQEGSRVGLITFSAGVDGVKPPVRGRGGFASVLATLAETEPRSQGGASHLEACVPLVLEGSSSVVLSDFLTPDALRGGLDLLLSRKCRVQAIQVLSPEETSSSRDGETWLRDVETGKRRRLPLGKSSRESARARLLELQESLLRHCRRRGIPLTQCESTSSWRDVFLAHLRALGSFHA